MLHYWPLSHSMEGGQQNILAQVPQKALQIRHGFFPCSTSSTDWHIPCAICNIKRKYVRSLFYPYCTDFGSSANG